MGFLSRLTLAFVFFCGSLPQSQGNAVVQGCAHAVATDSVTAGNVTAGKKQANLASTQFPASAQTPSGKQTDCEMPCCREHKSALQACCVVPSAADRDQAAHVPADQSQDSLHQQTSDETSCPCCPGNCCLSISSPISGSTPVADMIGIEASSALVLENELISSRSDPPALPPPRVIFVA